MCEIIDFLFTFFSFLLYQIGECTGSDGSSACWNQGSCTKALSDFCTSTVGGMVRFSLPPRDACSPFSSYLLHSNDLLRAGPPPRTIICRKKKRIPSVRISIALSPADPGLRAACPQPKLDLCTPAALCRPASPVWTKGHYSQCNSDQGCASYGTNDWSRPPRYFCCDEMAQMANFYCTGVDPVKLAKWGTDYYGKSCTSGPNCVIQGFNSSVPFLASSSMSTPTAGVPAGAPHAAAASLVSVTAAAAAAFVLASV
jgi:hypothetical protein